MKPLDSEIPGLGVLERERDSDSIKMLMKVPSADGTFFFAIALQSVGKGSII